MAISHGGSGVRVVIHDQVIYKRITNGVALDHIRDIADTTVHLGRIGAPKRTGNLARSVGRSRGASSGPTRSSVKVTATAYYAKWVLLGTRDVITSRRGFDKKMALPAGVGWPPIYAHFVSGQKANNFLARALNVAMHQHGH